MLIKDVGNILDENNNEDGIAKNNNKITDNLLFSQYIY